MMMMADGSAFAVRRPVPLTLCLQALFGSSVCQFGWLYFGIGLFFFWIFAGRSEVFAIWKFHGLLATTTGVITAVHDTKASESDGRIYALDYAFMPPGSEVRFTGTSYVTGEPYHYNGKVTVEYRANSPQVSRIHGLRTAEFGWPVIFVAIFPAVGLALLLWRFFTGLRALQLLKYGVSAPATLVSVQYTNVYAHRQGRIYRLTFEFTAGNGQRYTASCKTQYMKLAWLALYYQTLRNAGSYITAESKEGYLTMLGWLLPTETRTRLAMEIAALKQENPPDPHELQEILLYLPSNPTRTFFPASMFPNLSIDEQGQIHGHRPAHGIVASLLPALVLLGHGWYVLFLLTH